MLCDLSYCFVRHIGNWSIESVDVTNTLETLRDGLKTAMGLFGQTLYLNQYFIEIIDTFVVFSRVFSVKIVILVKYNVIVFVLCKLYPTPQNTLEIKGITNLSLSYLHCHHFNVHEYQFHGHWLQLTNRLYRIFHLHYSQCSTEKYGWWYLRYMKGNV